MWTFEYHTGNIIAASGEVVGQGYSGALGHVNDAADESLTALGPIPEGLWHIGEPFNSDRTGPYALPLMPAEGTETYGRTDFEIHGDSKLKPGTASHGCLVTAYSVRVQIWQSGDHALKVVAKLPVEGGIDEASFGGES